MKIFDSKDKSLLKKLLATSSKGEYVVVHEQEPSSILGAGSGTVHRFWTMNRSLWYQCELGIFFNDLRLRDLRIDDLHSFVQKTIECIDTLLLEPTETKSVDDQFFDISFVFEGYPFAVEIKRTGETFAAPWKQMVSTILSIPADQVRYGIVDIDPKKKKKESKSERSNQSTPQ